MKTSESKTQAINQAKSESYWSKIFEDYESSNLARSDYCRKHQISYDNFGYWFRFRKIIPAFEKNNLTTIFFGGNSGYTAEVEAFMKLVLDKNERLKKVIPSQQTVDAFFKYQKLEQQNNEIKKQMTGLQQQMTATEKNNVNFRIQINQLKQEQEIAQYPELLRQIAINQQHYLNLELKIKESNTIIKNLDAKKIQLEKGLEELKNGNNILKHKKLEYKFNSGNGYDLTFEDLKNKKDMIQLQCQSEGLRYSLYVGPYYKLQTGFISWGKLPKDFPKNEKDILANKGELIFHILRFTSAKEYYF